MIRVGVIGLGGMGKGRLRYYAQIPDARVEAIADVRANELCRDPDLANMLEVDPEELHWFDDYHELVVSGTVDTVDICLPSRWHRDASIAALEAGLHVLCEKPMALSSEDCDVMVAASHQAGRLLMIAQCIRFWPEYQFLVDMAKSGALGRLLSLQLSRQGGTPSRSWFCRAAESGGALLDLHVHDIDFFQYLLGLPQRLYAQGGMGQGKELGYDYMLTNLDHGDDRQISATAQWSKAPLPFVSRYEARFEEAYVRFESGVSPSMVIYRVDSEPQTPELGDGSGYLNEIRYFLQCLRSGTLPRRCLPEASRNSVALIEAIRASLEHHGMVRVDQFVPGAPAPIQWDSAGIEWLM